MRAVSEDCPAMEAGFILLNTLSKEEPSNAERMDQSIADGMLEFLQDDLSTLTA